MYKLLTGTLSVYFSSLMTSMREGGAETFHRSLPQSGSHPILGWCHFSFHFTLHSSIPIRNYFPHGGGKFMATSCMIKCPSWKQ